MWHWLRSSWVFNCGLGGADGRKNEVNDVASIVYGTFVPNLDTDWTKSGHRGRLAAFPLSTAADWSSCGLCGGVCLLEPHCGSCGRFGGMAHQGHHWSGDDRTNRDGGQETFLIGQHRKTSTSSADGKQELLYCSKCYTKLRYFYS